MNLSHDGLRAELPKEWHPGKPGLAPQFNWRRPIGSTLEPRESAALCIEGTLLTRCLLAHRSLTEWLSLRIVSSKPVTAGCGCEVGS
jgi:hypothetical protein